MTQAELQFNAFHLRYWKRTPCPSSLQQLRNTLSVLMMQIRFLSRLKQQTEIIDMPDHLLKSVLNLLTSDIAFSSFKRMADRCDADHALKRTARISQFIKERSVLLNDLSDMALSACSSA